jgi:enterochelin esterase family protein
VADGVHLPDPANGVIKPGVRLTESQLEVPGPEGEYQALKNVPHGDVRMIWYHSESLDKNRRMHIYLPPGYETGSMRYPVLYLLHGGGDNDDGWISIGRTNLILDNLVAERKAKPMIVVMPFIFAVPQGSPDYSDNPKLLEKDLYQDIMPYIEKHFRTLPGSANRAIGGLSMPDSLTDIAFPHLDKFNYIGFTSNGLSDEKLANYEKRLPGVLTDPANVKRVRFWIGDGTNAMTFPASSSLAKRMKERGYQTTFYTTDGVHGWPWFRKYVSEFAQTLFK